MTANPSMRIVLSISALVGCVLLGACRPKPETPPAPVGLQGKLPKDQADCKPPFVTLDNDNFGQCGSLVRGTSATKIRLRSDSKDFKTGCDVLFNGREVGGDHSCRYPGETQLFLASDRMSLVPIGNDTFRLKVTRSGMTISDVELHAVQLAAAGKYAWLKGVDNMGSPNEHTYFVYLAQTYDYPSGQPLPDKYYRVEVFSGALCSEHRPDYEGVALVGDCAKSSYSGAGQGNTGGGGEPGHHP